MKFGGLSYNTKKANTITNICSYYFKSKIFYLLNSSKNSLFNNCGFAFPLVSFIA